MLRILALRVAVTLMALAWLDSANAQVTILPATPKVHETVRVLVAQGALGISSDHYRLRHKVSMAGSKITVVIVNLGRVVTLPEPSPPIDQPLGQFPAGSYEVEVRVETAAGAVLNTVGTGTFHVLQTNDGPFWNMTDLWWVPAESGWGVNIVQHATGTIFATWFAYDEDGTPAWYVMPEGRWTADTQNRGPLYRTTGPSFCYLDEPCSRLAFDPASVRNTLVGEAVIDLSPYSYDQARVTFTVNGKTLRRDIRRQSF